jgi:hypothetical protein
MSAPVYASAGGRRYHNERFCQAAYNARALWKFDPMQWVPGMPLVMLTDGRDIHETTVLEALGAGKTPCHACIPGSDAALAVSSCEEDFGHQPEWADVGTCRMPNCQCPSHEDREVCARCIITRYKSYWATCFDEHGNEHRIYGSWLTARQPVTWPCTTAVILGLAPREVTP